MKKNDKSRYPILGMLLQEPMSGYDIIKEMQGSTDYFWQESDASIYPMLKTLEKEGKVKSKSEYVGKRESKIFEITPKGKKEFAAWTAVPAEKERQRNELLLKLFFGAHTTKEKILKQLLTKLQRAQEMKKKFKGIEAETLSEIPEKNPHKIFWSLTLRNGIIHAEAEIKWLNECIKILKEK